MTSKQIIILGIMVIAILWGLIIFRIFTHPHFVEEELIPGRFEYVCTYFDTVEQCFIFDTATGTIGDKVVLESQ